MRKNVIMSRQPVPAYQKAGTITMELLESDSSATLPSLNPTGPKGHVWCTSKATQLREPKPPVTSVDSIM
jgi:hypothetical protein